MLYTSVSSCSMIEVRATYHENSFLSKKFDLLTKLDYRAGHFLRYAFWELVRATGENITSNGASHLMICFNFA